MVVLLNNIIEYNKMTLSENALIQGHVYFLTNVCPKTRCRAEYECVVIYVHFTVRMHT